MTDYVDSIDDILKIDDLPTEDLLVPEWSNKTVRLRSLSGAERDEFESSQMTINKKGKPEANMENIRARLCSLVLVNAEGKKLVTNRQLVTILGGKSAKALDRIFEKAQEMNGLSDEDVEKLATDFKSDQSEDSDSA